MKKGFTLVELSIVLVIVGLLISGILIGQNMIRSSQLLQIQKNVFYYEIAAKKFIEIAKAVPGDIANAPALALGLGGSFGNGTGLVGYTPDGNGGSGHEYWSFFYHMEKLNLIKRPKAYADKLPYTPYIGPLKGTSGLKNIGLRMANNSYIPICGDTKMNVMYFVAEDLDKPDADFYITNKPIGLTATDAAEMDQKFDDGLPESGNIWTYGYGSLPAPTGRGDCKTADYSKYNLNSTFNGCPLAFCMPNLKK